MSDILIQVNKLKDLKQEHNHLNIELRDIVNRLNIERNYIQDRINETDEKIKKVSESIVKELLSVDINLAYYMKLASGDTH